MATCSGQPKPNHSLFEITTDAHSNITSFCLIAVYGNDNSIHSLQGTPAR
jgi:hypothetical protein